MTEKYGIEEYLKEFEEIINEKEPIQGQTAQPNLLKGLIARTRLGKGKEKMS